MLYSLLDSRNNTHVLAGLSLNAISMALLPNNSLDCSWLAGDKGYQRKLSMSLVVVAWLTEFPGGKVQ